MSTLLDRLPTPVRHLLFVLLIAFSLSIASTIIVAGGVGFAVLPALRAALDTAVVAVAGVAVALYLLPAYRHFGVGSVPKTDPAMAEWLRTVLADPNVEGLDVILKGEDAPGGAPLLKVDAGA